MPVGRPAPAGPFAAGRGAGSGLLVQIGSVICGDAEQTAEGFSLIPAFADSSVELILCSGRVRIRS